MSLNKVPHVKVSYQLIIYTTKSISITNHASAKARSKYYDAWDTYMDEGNDGMREYECIENQKVYIPYDKPYDKIKDIGEYVESTEEEDMRRVHQTLRQRHAQRDGKTCLQCNPRACIYFECAKHKVEKKSDLRYLVWGYKFIDDESDNPEEDPAIKDEFEFETDSLEKGVQLVLAKGKQQFNARLIDQSEGIHQIVETHGSQHGICGGKLFWLVWLDEKIHEQFKDVE